jgi:hypothetical protein
VFSAPVVDGKATFKLLPSDGANQLAMIAAVGYADTTGTIATSAALIPQVRLDSGPQHYIVELAAAHDGLTPPGAREGVFVDIWQQEQAPNAKCIGFERWSAGQPDPDKRVFIVPRGDPDCDDWVVGAGECAAYAHDGATIPNTSELVCVAQFENATGCRLGGAGCVDGGTTTEGCVAPSSYCVPDAYCGLGCPETRDGLFECLKAAVATTEPPTVVCEVPMKKSSDFGHYETCGSAGSAALDIAAQVGTRCVAGENQPLLALTAGTAPTFTGELQLVDSGFSLLLKAKHETECTYRIEWSGSRSLNAETHPVFFRFTTTSGGAPTHLLLPLRLVTVPDEACQTEARCFIDGLASPGGDLFGCAQASP